MDLTGVRTFLAVVEAGQFQEAAAALAITQQAVSKRIAALEKQLGVRLFGRTARGAELTVEGRAFLPHARELMRVAGQAEASVRPNRRGLRVDVVARRIVTATLLQDFHRAHPEIELDVVTLDGDLEAALTAVDAGTIDATFHAVPPHRRLPAPIRTARVIDEPHELLVGPRHPLADAPFVTPVQLRDHRTWIPGLPTGGEAAQYYAELTAAFGFAIDTHALFFAKEAFLEEISASEHLSTLVGAGTRYLWPDRYDLRRIPVRHPSPIYPLSIIWRAGNPHPALTGLRDYLVSRRADLSAADTWLPTWGRTS
ncbi:LysR family transcriptional regulator [Nocardia yunnanensis]|uniref:LysR family transcriptional regulator n=1 Tax=Nocardia yunnanensis TaxID=2382165 RepID=A0A386Z5V0_9NOCA|nr:LysR family transcriptional regulator [Nocardia yunnanensis]AYF72966.1 LysR family transcriptional regulator [Nocardia yunnanensis]